MRIYRLAFLAMTVIIQTVLLTATTPVRGHDAGRVPDFLPGQEVGSERTTGPQREAGPVLLLANRDVDRIIRNAYEDILRREPDPGSGVWVDKVLNERWTVEDVARALRDSDEYRRKRR